MYMEKFKGTLDKYNIILQTSSPNFKKKSCDFYSIWSIGIGNDCMPSFTF